jgi:hypothetical protein
MQSDSGLVCPPRSHGGLAHTRFSSDHCYISAIAVLHPAPYFGGGGGSEKCMEIRRNLFTAVRCVPFLAQLMLPGLIVGRPMLAAAVLGLPGA